MKMIVKQCKIGTLLLMGISALVVIMLSSCATKVPFQYSAEAPAARGTVKVKKDGNNNYTINVDLTNLSEANRLVAPKTAYVVWMEGNGDRPKNLGKIESNSSMMSKTLKASFETVSSVKPTKIFITSEEDGNTTYPSNSVILTTNNF
jgi:hypothetical protein